ncbi:hypothetical protein AKJ66_01040 [candidate division MSBL1 archaeon SCGC-AAA259E22]|uniref:Uncharacterized protein n=1 Tax=candidate division MSBL1 archaeon SCGC-AAA259E22 TaxID=1698265 RepID=A0A133UI73_9EURY|nr:hypothetical protein AKJ66_01040 [candidate division MSBL1 archaeon SCGC-AAA259E22]
MVVGEVDASIVWYRRRPSITCALPLENSFIPINKLHPLTHVFHQKSEEFLTIKKNANCLGRI